MMVSTGEPLAVWGLILAIGIGIFALRLSFVHLYAGQNELSPRLERALKFVPVAILAAIVVPDVVVIQGPVESVESLLDVFVTPRTLAAGVAFLVARRTGNMLVTVVIGMGTLWGLQFLFS